MQLRPAAVAGLFYPVDAEHLRHQLDQYLQPDQETTIPVKALIVPHAGYMYSGEIAASAYRHLQAQVADFRRVVLLGPAHREYIRGIGASTASAFATPLGDIPLLEQAAKELVRDFSFVHYADQAHAEEHSLEVQLPFLQHVLDDFAILPLLVGESDAQQVASVLAAVWGGNETLVIVSSDLSHFLNYKAAQTIDQATTVVIENYQGGELTGRHACGHIPVAGLLHYAGKMGLDVSTLDVRNSGDTAGSRDRVVGYGAWAFSPLPQIDEETRVLLTRSAQQAIAESLSAGQAQVVDPQDYPVACRRHAASFVTLEIDGQLRGCMGTLEATRPMVCDIRDNAFAAAFRDPRFPKLAQSELDCIDIHISVLANPVELECRNEAELLAKLVPGKDGLILRDGLSRSTFLPAVWEKLPHPGDFVTELKRKAGLPADHWSPDIRFERYSVESW